MYSQLQEWGESKCTVLRGTSIEQDPTKIGTDQKGISQKLGNMMLIVDASTKYIFKHIYVCPFIPHICRFFYTGKIFGE